MIVYDRIDLKATGAWARNFRPNGLTLAFGSDLAGGKRFETLANVTLPYGSIIGTYTRAREDFTNYTVNNLSLPRNTAGTQVTGVATTSKGVTFPATAVITSEYFPPGVLSNGTKTYLKGAVVTGYIPAVTAAAITLSVTAAAYGTIVTGGVRFSALVTLENVLIPFGTKFTTPLTIGGVLFPASIYQVGVSEQFDMHTIQLVDSTKNALMSVHGVSTSELMAFNRGTADIDRLIMYKDGIGVGSDIFACYSITFKTTATYAEILEFNKNHPSDINPIILDDGSILNPNIIIPQ